LAATAAFADPTFASEAAIEQVVPYTAHAAAVMDSSDLGVDSADQPAQVSQEVILSSPVVSHAIAEIAPVQAAPAAAPAADPAPVSRSDEPAERDGRSLAQMVRDFGDDQLSGAEAECLARAVYWESNGEPLAGQLAVAEVIINRSRSGRFPSSICGVVRQRSQFSFVRGGHIPAPPRNSGWRNAVGVAHVAMQDLADSSASRALFFHARRVSPGWRNLTRVATVGNHVFYR
jgi:spore germination cell wall hydrolase CwlJ-like protein